MPMIRFSHSSVAGFAFGCFLLILSIALPQRNSTAALPNVHFVDIAARAGLTAKTEEGGEETKKYIIETTGSGAAFFDYDKDGWPDIFLVNGTTLEGFPKGKEPTSHLYHNNRDGTFTDVTQKAHVALTGW